MQFFGFIVSYVSDVFWNVFLRKISFIEKYVRILAETAYKYIIYVVRNFSQTHKKN